jgi:hypothetical protein
MRLASCYSSVGLFPRSFSSIPFHSFPETHTHSHTDGHDLVLARILFGTINDGWIGWVYRVEMRMIMINDSMMIM